MAATIAEQIYEKLVDRIIAGELRPGQRVEEQVVAGEFGVSRTPVRDALRQLAGTGLVEFRPNRGVTVADIKFAELAEMFEALGELEALCAKLSAQRMTQLERTALEKVHAEAAAAAQAEDSEEFYRTLNNQLHQMIYQGAHNDSIATITENFRRRIMPFRSFAGVASHRIHASDAEHEELVAAILASDSARAYDAMRNHVAQASLAVLDLLKRHQPTTTAT
jgi:DNA-binding GntR family transcriptional regulator